MTERIKDDYTKYYDLGKVIGNGGFGIVYEGMEKKTKELRAIKVINLNKIEKAYIESQISKPLDKEINDLKNEFEIMKKFSGYENSVKGYEYFLNQNNFVIIMELCDKSLEDWLFDKYKQNERKRGFNNEEIYKILIQLNKIFKAMEENQIVHRDLKPENILVKFIDDKNFLIKLSDYGCSKRLEIFSSKKMITTQGVGTILYMVPEIINKEEYNFKCDLWSLGIIIYRLYFFNSPFIGIIPTAIINNLKSFNVNLLKKQMTKI